MDERISRVSVIIPEFRDGSRAINAVQALLAQSLPAGITLEVIVVDDGSADGTADKLRTQLPNMVRLLALPENRGRSAARQRGIQAATGELVGFLDSDCEPTTVHFLSRHIAAFTRGVVANTGPIVGVDNTFWDRYQRAASNRRQQLHARGVHYVGTTTNLFVRAKAIERIQGFDLRYSGYGFEDRDFLIRVSSLGSIAWTDEAEVRHLDEITMVSLSNKMLASGRENARLFAAQHPTEYVELGYAAIDVHEYRSLYLLALFLSRLVRPLSRAFDLIGRWLPLRVGLIVARVLSAASFLVGTSQVRVPKALGNSTEKSCT